MSEVERRDLLAAHRTTLANQRTLLSFITASLTMLIAGVSLIKFLGGSNGMIGGVTLLALSPAVFALGLYNYLRFKRIVRHVAAEARSEER